jgi:hypothetical protein
LDYREHTGDGLGYFRDGLQSFEIFVYKPHAVQIRARYLDGNAPVGQNSDTVNIVTTP